MRSKAEMAANMASEGFWRLLEGPPSYIVSPNCKNTPSLYMAFVMNQCEILRIYVDRKALRFIGCKNDKLF